MPLVERERVEQGEEHVDGDRRPGNDPGDASEGEWQPSSATGFLADVRAAVAQLPDHERVVVEMRYFDDLSQREIAERLAVPCGTVKARASRGIRRLGKIIRIAEQT